jgi:hypothetical protein
MTKNSGDQWGTPQNLGYPINSTRDDIYYYNVSKEFMKNADYWIRKYMNFTLSQDGIFIEVSN